MDDKPTLIKLYNWPGVGDVVGRLVGCDPDYGVTIVDKDDPKVYYLCWIGPHSPVRKDLHLTESAPGTFEQFREWIDRGFIDFNKLEVYVWETQKAPIMKLASAKTCPFSQ